jgi:hypothetical protein
MRAAPRPVPGSAGLCVALVVLAFLAVSQLSFDHGFFQSLF